MLDTTISVSHIDAAYLSLSRFLVGRTRTSYGYRFHQGSEEKVILLPNVGATRFEDRDNLLFHPRVWLLYDASKDGKFSSLRKTRHGEHPRQEEAEVPEVIYGSKRYNFEPYADPISGTALIAAHEHISLLQRLARWQGKQIRKLVKQVKKQGKQIKKLLKDSSSPTRQTEMGDSSMAMALSGPQPEGAEPSTHQRRGKAPLSPSSSGSGNLSYSMESSSPSPSH